MVRKVNHSGNIFIRDVNRTYIPGDIVQFKYKTDDNYDNKPVVFILNKDLKTIRGVNINYLDDFKIEKLLEEKNYKNMTYYSFYEKTFRTYSISKMSMIKIVEYKTNRMLREEKKINENKL